MTAQSAREPDIGSDEGEEDHGDDTIHGEEGGIKPTQVAWGDDEVFVEQQESYDGDTYLTGEAEVEEDGEPGEQGDDGEVKYAGDPEGGGEADGLRDAEETCMAVVVHVLAGVEDVKAGYPAGDDGGEQGDAGIERAADCDPGSGRGDAECEAENNVREARQALHIGVAEQDGQHHRRKDECQAVELPACQFEDGNHEQRETEDEAASEQAGGNGAHLGAGIGGIEVSVGPAIEGHGGGAGRDHGYEYPGECAPSGNAVSS